MFYTHFYAVSSYDMWAGHHRIFLIKKCLTSKKASLFFTYKMYSIQKRRKIKLSFSSYLKIILCIDIKQFIPGKGNNVE